MKKSGAVGVQLHEVYPLNVYKEIARITYDDLEKVTECNIKEVLEALCELSDRSRKVIQYRYSQGLTLSEVGALFGVTGNRIRQIERDAIRELRKMNFGGRMSVRSLEDVKSKYVDEVNALRKDIATITKAYLELKNEKELSEIIEPLENYESIIDKPLEDWGFTSRTFNALARFGCRTIRDLLERYKKHSDFEFEEFLTWHVRNLGVLSAKEVTAKLEKEGIIVRSHEELKLIIEG
jgi:transcriptional regulator with XRE-family HTH domain